MSNRTQAAPARMRHLPLLPIGRGDSHAPRPEQEWITIPVPALVEEETFTQVQDKLATN